MSFLVASSELLASAATGLADIGTTISAASSAASPATTGMMPAAADEVSQAIAALFSTASAINATLFGSANVCYMIARDGELPAGLSRTEWKDAIGGLLLTAGLVVVVMLIFDLSGIAMMGSAAFLLIYAAVNAGHLKVLDQTGASAIVVWLSLLTCLAMFAILCVYTYQEQPRAIAALILIAAASFAAEWGYRRWTGRWIKE